MEENELIEKITKEILSKLEKMNITEGADKSSTSGKNTPEVSITPEELAGYLDHTLLKPGATEA
ncbi:MAG: 2-deoxyribose-5-phosphate aldolase, partial [Bacteroidetes bacterium CG_4_10_14_3_um_filter_42_6]